MCVFETSAFRNGYYNRSIFIHRSRLRSVLLSFFLFFLLFLYFLLRSILPSFFPILRVYIYIIPSVSKPQISSMETGRLIIC